MGTDNGTLVEYIHNGLSWMHLSKLLVYQVQKDLGLEDLGLDAVRDSRFVSDRLRQIRLMYVEI